MWLPIDLVIPVFLGNALIAGISSPLDTRLRLGSNQDVLPLPHHIPAPDVRCPPSTVHPSYDHRNGSLGCVSEAYRLGNSVVRLRRLRSTKYGHCRGRCT